MSYVSLRSGSPARAALAVLLVLASTATAQHRLLVVDDDDPSAPFQRIEDALAQAQNGAFVFVRGGTYGPGEHLLLDGRGLTLIGEPDTQVVVRGSLTIRNLPLAQTVTVQGLTFQGAGGVSETLLVEACNGPVVIEESTLLSAPTAPGPRAAARIMSSGKVIVARSTITSQTQLSVAVNGEPGLETIGSTVHVFDSAIQGGPAGSDASGSIREGGPGLQVSNGGVILSGTSVVGGVGSQGSNGGGCADGGPGGPAVEIAAGSPLVTHEACTLQGGPGGQPMGAGICSPGSVGVQSRGGTLSLLPTNAHRTFDVVPSAIFPGDEVELRFRGNPGDLAVLIAAPRTSPAFLPVLGGSLTVQPLLLILMPGSVGLDGNLTVKASASFFKDVHVEFLQGVFFDVLGARVDLSSPASLVFLTPLPDHFEVPGQR